MKDNNLPIFDAAFDLFTVKVMDFFVLETSKKNFAHKTVLRNYDLINMKLLITVSKFL